MVYFNKLDVFIAFHCSEFQVFGWFSHSWRYPPWIPIQQSLKFRVEAQQRIFLWLLEVLLAALGRAEYLPSLKSVEQICRFRWQRVRCRQMTGTRGSSFTTHCGSLSTETSSRLLLWKSIKVFHLSGVLALPTTMDMALLRQLHLREILSGCIWSMTTSSQFFVTN